MTKSFILAGTAIAVTLATGPAMAQTVDQAAEEGGDIIVTARRVAEPLQSTPVAVSAFGGEQLRATSSLNVGDLNKLVPNLTLVGGRGLSGQGFVFIRGIGQTDDNPATDPGVAQYIDDVYVGRTQGTQFDFNDIGSIEVLRGPQGTVYGKNAIGGAVKINSKLPDNDPSAHFSLGYGNYDDLRLSASFSQPIVEDRLFVRVSGQTHHNRGYMENITVGKNSSNAETYAGRIILRFTPTDDWDIWLSADVSRDNSRPLDPRIVRIDPNHPRVLGAAAVGVDIRPFLLTPGTNPFKGGGFDSQIDPTLADNRNRITTSGASLHLAYDLGQSQLKSITAYRKMFSGRLSDSDGAGVPFVNSYASVDQNQFSQELQYVGSSADEKFEWLAGLYFYRENFVNVDQSHYLVDVGPRLSFERHFEQTALSYAGFLNAGYKLSDGLRVSLGGRYTHEKKRIVISSAVLTNPADITFPETGRRASFDDFSPKVTIDYQASRDIFLYASAAKGFKSGGFNGRATLNQALDSVGSEKVWSYEAGVKSQWWGRRFTFNLATFYMDYRDIQAQVYVPRVDGTPGLTAVVLNAAQAKIQGIEIETRLQPVPSLTLSGNLGYTDAEYSKPFLNNLGADYTANALPLTPS